MTLTGPQHHKKKYGTWGRFELGWESIIIFPIYNYRKYSRAIRFFAIRPVFRNELESDNES